MKYISFCGNYTNFKIPFLLVSVKCLSHSLCDVRLFVIERAPNNLTHYEIYGIIYINKKGGSFTTFYSFKNIKHIAEQFIPSWIA
jgi:hypothetical protein